MASVRAIASSFVIVTSLTQQLLICKVFGSVATSINLIICLVKFNGGRNSGLICASRLPVSASCSSTGFPTMQAMVCVTDALGGGGTLAQMPR